MGVYKFSAFFLSLCKRLLSFCVKHLASWCDRFFIFFTSPQLPHFFFPLSVSFGNFTEEDVDEEEDLAEEEEEDREEEVADSSKNLTVFLVEMVRVSRVRSMLLPILPSTGSRLLTDPSQD